MRLSDVWFWILCALIISYCIGVSHANNARVEERINRRKAEVDAHNAASAREAIQKIEAHERDATNRVQQLEAGLISRQSVVDGATAAFEQGFIRGRNWLAKFIAEASKVADDEAVRDLSEKKHRALRAAEEVRSAKTERRAAVERAKFLEYELATLKEYFPVIAEYEELILDERIDGLDSTTDDINFDRAQLFLSREEYEQLPTAEKYQRALDAYVSRPKNSFGIGRFYERYIGYQYETKGWDVTFFGALQGKADLGRDLLCTKDGRLHVVQAKCWSKDKQIHEKHVFQLYGTTILMRLQAAPDVDVQPIFVTTTSLSDVANKVAKHLGVTTMQIALALKYPMIKCNVNGKEKIYHLPFDQQYDRVKIASPPECYVTTVMEAEALGFRRAMRFRGAVKA